jgi:hypothetical protein
VGRSGVRFLTAILVVQIVCISGFSMETPPRTPLVKLRKDMLLNSNSTMDVAEVPEEFACPLFDSKAYENILDSLNKLNDAVKTVVQCPNAPNQSLVNENSEKIKEAVKTLKPFFDNPENAYGNIKQIEDAIAKAVLGVDGITQTFVNPSFANTPCGQNAHYNGGIASTLSNLVNSLGPYALLGISLAPGLSLAIKGGALALIAGSTAYNEYQKLVFSRSLDMDNHDHWRAVVQNTCAYSRVARKLNYIQRYESGLIPAVENTPEKVLPEDIQQKAIAFQKKYNEPNDLLGQYILINSQDKTRFELVTRTLRESRQEIDHLYSQLGDMTKPNADLTCSLGLDLAEQAKIDTEFPASLVTSIQLLSDFKVDLRAYTGLNKSYERLITSLQKLSQTDLDKNEVINDCATKTKSLLEILTRTIVAYEKTLKDVELAREANREKNPEYRKWKQELTDLETQQRMGQQLYMVVKTISDSPAILKSYLNQRQAVLKRSLLGPSSWLSSHPPVYMWLEYTLSLHNSKIEDFEKNISYLSSDLFNLKARQLHTSKKPTLADNKKIREAFLASFDFSLLDISNFNLNDPVSRQEHQLVCQRLLHTWDAWSQSVNHLDAVGAFCEMIDPLLDSSVDKNIIKFCRGSEMDINYVSRGTSRVAEALKEILKPTNFGQRNLEQLALMIPNRLKAMKCSLPAAN